MLNLVHLRVLAAVARHGSVTEAAKELQYSQPSVSHHLSRLEAATGAKLVGRVGRGIRLTPEGQLLANRATEIVGRVDAATKELAAQVGYDPARTCAAGPPPTRRPHHRTNQLPPSDLRRHLRRATRPARHHRIDSSHPRLRLIAARKFVASRTR